MQVTFDYAETDAAKIYTSVIGNLMDAVEDPLYPGDERRIFGEALVAVLVNLYHEFNDKMKQRTLQYARGFVLDAIGARYNVERATPSHAFAMFRFIVDAVQKENIIIPVGTQITTDGSVYFATEVSEVLPAGETEIIIRAVCKDGGADYNGLTPGTIATLVDLIPYISGAEIILPSVQAAMMANRIHQRETTVSENVSDLHLPHSLQQGQRAATDIGR